MVGNDFSGNFTVGKHVCEPAHARHSPAAQSNRSENAKNRWQTAKNGSFSTSSVKIRISRWLETIFHAILRYGNMFSWPLIFVAQLFWCQNRGKNAKNAEKRPFFDLKVEYLADT
jgi:hypothetical protein